MPLKVNKNVIDANLRAQMFAQLNMEGLTRINDRTFGAIVKDGNNHDRYVRVNVVVAEEREDATPQDIMRSEINIYNEKQAEKAAKAAENAEKAKQDAQRRKEKTKKNG